MRWWQICGTDHSADLSVLTFQRLRCPESPAAFAQGKLVEDLDPPCEVGLAPLAAEDLALLDED